MLIGVTNISYQFRIKRASFSALIMSSYEIVIEVAFQLPAERAPLDEDLEADV